MLIALDFDDTYTRDPQMWDMIIGVMQRHGHTVICATMRFPQEGEELHNTIGKKCKIVFTSRKAKKIYLNEVIGIFPDIWIDDTPEWLFQGG